MARQPYISLTDTTKPTGIDVGIQAIGKRPQLERIVGHCLSAWPHVEGEAALFFSQLIGTDTKAALVPRHSDYD